MFNLKVCACTLYMVDILVVSFTYLKNAFIYISILISIEWESCEYLAVRAATHFGLSATLAASSVSLSVSLSLYFLQSGKRRWGRLQVSSYTGGFLGCRPSVLLWKDQLLYSRLCKDAWRRLWLGFRAAQIKVD